MLDLILGPLMQTIGAVVEHFFPDATKAAEFKAQLVQAVLADRAKLQLAAADIIKTEEGSPHFITANWRGIVMLVFTAIIANNYVIAPYTAALFGVHVSLPLPPEMWDLLKLGLGGFVAVDVAKHGASAAVAAFKRGGNDG